jgi:hypothetical protein
MNKNITVYKNITWWKYEAYRCPADIFEDSDRGLFQGSISGLGRKETTPTMRGNTNEAKIQE